MANLKNAIKQIRKDEKRTARNLKVRADLKTLIKQTKKSIEGKEKNVEELMLKIQKSIDKAVQKKIIEKNAGSRKLSRMFAFKKKNEVK